MMTRSGLPSRLRLSQRLLLRLANAIDVARRAYLMSQIGLHGKNIVLRPNITITHPERLLLGSNIMINHGSMIFASGRVTMGSDVVIGPGSMILTGNHVGEIFYGNTETQPITIGSNVWLGAGVVVTPGASIGDNVIVAAGSVVSGQIPSNSIVGGVPARIIRELVLPFEPRHYTAATEPGEPLT
ncbi:DapH/DapD/GlmU-related protein [Ferrovibrio sp.]|uniref:acyltransferase n=1 Tax=Ferrovibrio sp. TaxID=1917215 RepID=UPI002617C976|nr:DapH/DapD/GlmU-related protein [Ferrovibrio sp.]